MQAKGAQEEASRKVRGKKEIIMIIPVRCMTCGKVIGHLWEEFKRRVETGESAEKILNDLGLKRYCCRQVFLGHIDLLKDVAQFKP